MFLLEIALDVLDDLPWSAPRQRDIPRVPAATRDLSLLLPRDVPYGEVVDTLAAIDPPAHLGTQMNTAGSKCFISPVV